jgi:hypothetical protein
MVEKTWQRALDKGLRLDPPDDPPGSKAARNVMDQASQVTAKFQQWQQELPNQQNQDQAKRTAPPAPTQPSRRL